MLDIAVVLTVFALIFVAELPDKDSRRRPSARHAVSVAVGLYRHVAFLTHVVIVVAAGSLLALLPQRLVEAVVAVLFLIGAVLVWREGLGNEQDHETEVQAVADSTGFWKVASLGYVVIFVAEWGDLTQILTANLAAKYNDPLSVGIGAVLGLWAVALLAIRGGSTLLKVLPSKWTRIAAVVIIALGCYSIIEVFRG